MHYYPQAGIAEITLEAHRIDPGSEMMIIGATTGVLSRQAEGLHREGKPVSLALQGETITLKVPERVRVHDKVFVIVPRTGLT